MLAALLSPLWVWVSMTPPARAHPFDATVYGHDLRVEITETNVRVDYRAEVPTVDALADLRRFLDGVEDVGPEHQRAYTERTLEELQTGLEVLVDGAPLELSAVARPDESGVGDRRFVTFRVSLVGELPHDAATLQIVNANFPNERALFSNSIWVAPSIRVVDSDQYDEADGQVRLNRMDRWLPHESQRELRVVWSSLGRLRAWTLAKLSAWVAPDLPPLRAAIDARDKTYAGASVLASASMGSVGNALCAASVLGALEGGLPALLFGLAMRRRKQMRWIALASVVLAVGLAFSPMPSEDVVVRCGVASLLGVVGFWRWRRSCSSGFILSALALALMAPAATRFAGGSLSEGVTTLSVGMASAAALGAASGLLLGATVGEKLRLNPLMSCLVGSSGLICAGLWSAGYWIP